jgi:hypothetical protein
MIKKSLNPLIFKSLNDENRNLFRAKSAKIYR